jgi:hypothetical protein
MGGKLDAGPNPIFDRPTFSDDLADLPIEMQTFLRVLRASLPANAGHFVRNCLDEYANELLVRGNRPILGTLNGLASAIARQLWTDSAMRTSGDPEDWTLREPMEWDAGIADLFRTFFRKHGALIQHFPKDAEREDLLKSLPIDEAAASGEALTGPVELVTGLIGELHDKGMATDEIVRIMAAHAEYTRNVAWLPPTVEVAADTVTPKRRHVLMTAAFYLDIYSVLGSTASLGPYAPHIAAQVLAAAQALLSFIK